LKRQGQQTSAAFVGCWQPTERLAYFSLILIYFNVFEIKIRFLSKQLGSDTTCS
jgi:hypothetical protein